MNESNNSRKSFVLIFLILGIFVFLQKVAHFPQAKNEKRYRPPQKAKLDGSWKTDEPRINQSFKAGHSDFHNSYHVSSILGPSLKLDWITEKDKVFVEGPTIDKNGNLYVSPFWSSDDSILFSLEPKKGQRRWGISGYGHGGGAPLILEDPETKKEIIYISVYDKAFAVTTEGKILWERSTGLSREPTGTRYKGYYCYGLNYLKKYDVLVGLMGDGHLIFLDRKTGTPIISKPFLIPGSPWGFKKREAPEWLEKRANKELLPFAEGLGIKRPYTESIDTLLERKTKVAHNFSINKNSGRIWVVGTAPDGIDHKIDDVSDFGALYGIDLIKKKGMMSLEVSCEYFFNGGPGSTPVLSGKGDRVYIGTGKNSLVALDSKTCKQAWAFESKERFIGAPAVDQKTKEIYISTLYSVLKIKDAGNRAEKIWSSHINAYKLALFQESFQMLTPLITPSGIVISFAAGYKKKRIPIPITLAFGVLDKRTGKIRFFSEAKEESAGGLSLGREGSLYVSHSPLRRAMSRAIFSDLIKPLMGGVAKYSSSSSSLFLKEILDTILSYEKNVNLGSIGDSWKMTFLDILSQAQDILTLLVKESSFQNENFYKIEKFFIKAKHFLEKDDVRSFFSLIKKSKKQLK